MKIGVACGVFDMFHVGHLNLLRTAKSMCDRLIVGVTTDELADGKGKQPRIPFNDRIDIIRNIKGVDGVFAQNFLDKFELWKQLKYDVLFVGDDWLGHPSWKSYEKWLAEKGVDVVYLPYTDRVSSSQLRGE